MAELKTKKQVASVEAFLARIEDPRMRDDCRAVAAMMQKATGKRPAMWGTSIVGFGDYHYVYATGREGDWFELGFSPRKANLTLYLMSGVERYATQLKTLGKHKTGKGCLYLTSLASIDSRVLATLLARSVKDLRAGKV